MYMYIPFLLLILEITEFSPDTVSYALNHNIPLIFLYHVDLLFVYLLQKLIPINLRASTTLCPFAKTLVSRYLSKETPTHVLHKKRDFSGGYFAGRARLCSFFPTAESQRQLAKAIVASGRGRSVDLSRELTRGRRPLSLLFGDTVAYFVFLGIQMYVRCRM